MQRNTTEDRRKRRTKKLLKNAFLHMLKQKDITQISVTSLCEMVDINRTTFYLHYNDIYDLLEDFENDFLNQIDTFVDTIILSPLTSLEVTKAVLTFIYENKEILSLFLIQKKEEYFYKRIDVKVRQLFSIKTRQIYKVYTNEEEFEKILSFFTYGFYGIYYDWIKNDCKEDIDKIANLTTQLSTAYFDATLHRK